ncbi:hypothetical protein [Ramlibacter sp.]|uniref:hypothetical protein n=1 Tax=Ramlibacter sp. TaxID=1917967 RepID=UPI002CD74CB5|nr:hypothetical protein [Ramlibacter sp.]HWI84312.1 hypothetical protein [Ramlibacter sp.]
MKNEVIGLVRNNSMPVGFPVCTELTPSNVGNMSARILAVLEPAEPVSSSDLRGMIAARFGKRYDNLEDFADKLRFLVGTGHLLEQDRKFAVTEKGASLIKWIHSARPQMLRRSTSANESDASH